jgi:uncharacterized protein (DUF952 family)
LPKLVEVAQSQRPRADCKFSRAQPKTNPTSLNPLTNCNPTFTSRRYNTEQKLVTRRQALFFPSGLLIQISEFANIRVLLLGCNLSINSPLPSRIHTHSLSKWPTLVTVLYYTVAMDTPATFPKFIYKIVPASSPPPSPLPLALPVSDLDKRDNFIHASTSAQILGTLNNFFKDDELTYILRIPYERVAKWIKWEDAKGKFFFSLSSFPFFPRLSWTKLLHDFLTCRCFCYTPF